MLSASKLAKLLGVSTSTISQVERGELPPSPKVAVRLEEKYGISRQWYLTGEGEAPWESKTTDEYFETLGEMLREAQGDESKITSLKGAGAFFAGSKIVRTPEKKLVDYFMEAGKNPEFRVYIYKCIRQILEPGKTFEWFQAQREKLEHEKETTPIPKAYVKEKFKPKKLRMIAEKNLTYEPTEIVLEFPEKPDSLTDEESRRWDRNELALHRWEKTQAAFTAPTEALEKFCRQVVGLYAGGTLQDIGAILKDFMEEGEK